MLTSAGWETMKSILNLFANIMQYILVPTFIYYFVISVFGWFKRKEVPAEQFSPVNRFAMLVAAHNEEIVIGSIIRNLKELNYPSNLYDIFVIADNCSDKTAVIARGNGAQVYERFNREKIGKGFALEWMFKIIFKMDRKYDAVCILDADNLVSPNFLMEMNKQLCRGYKVVQGYLGCKNPRDSWVSGCYSISYWLTNRLFQLPRYYLGLSCGLGGTGFIVSTEVLKQIGWGATCLTEDLEFTLKLALKNMKVYWSHEAVVYDEKPLTMAQSWRQRKRWMRGQADCARRYLKDLLVKAFKDRDMVTFDCAMYILYPMIVVVNGALLLVDLGRLALYAGSMNFFSADIISFTLIQLIVMNYSIIFLIAEGKLSDKLIFYYFLLPVYSLTWIPIIIQGFLDRDNTEWSHTIHTRSLDIADMNNLKKAG
jgi:cellulose synthase/poly-beta-1,6-N-acetylglucosamine synthase-like glycosyltransferase